MVGAIRCDIEDHLVRGARARAGHRGAETHGDRAMQVTRDDALDLRIPRNDLLKLDRRIECYAIHMPNAGNERWVTQRDKGGLRALARRPPEPRQSLVTQRAPALPRNHGVECDY